MEDGPVVLTAITAAGPAIVGRGRRLRGRRRPATGESAATATVTASSEAAADNGPG
ncbi:hypothetical protein [Streptomyces sp. cg40]|uniref:hypothetical protein n=1 Tax=Streptomyces sp. cg40 TaxID=3419764 RepID=UPI003D0303AB